MKCLLCDREISKIIKDIFRNDEKRNVFYCEGCELGTLEDEKSKEELKKFIQKINLEYKKLLSELGITANLSFIGRKNGT